MFGLLALTVFYAKLPWFPVGRLSEWALREILSPEFSQYTRLHTLDAILNLRPDIFWDAFRHLVLPVVTLSYLSWALLLGVTRSATLEALNQDYVRTARAKGLKRAYAQQGKFPRAEKEYRAALRGYQHQGSLFQLSEIHDRLGAIYADLGDSSKSMTHLELARQGWENLGNRRELAVTLNNMAFQYHEQGHYEAAEPLATESISIAEATNNPRDEAYALMTLADIQRERGEYPESLASCERSLELARQCMERHLVSYGLVAMAETYKLMKDADRARSLLNEALAMAGEGDQQVELGLALTSLGTIE